MVDSILSKASGHFLQLEVIIPNIWAIFWPPCTKATLQSIDKERLRLLNSITLDELLNSHLGQPSKLKTERILKNLNRSDHRFVRAIAATAGIGNERV